MFKKYKDYVKDNPKGYWFKRKWYGWGWTPVKWQGWLVTALYIILVIAFAMTLDENSTDREAVLTFGLPLILLTASFITIVYKKSEKPKWQWGIDENKNNQNYKDDKNL
ncbi:MAG: hypothetical protein WCX70_02750 [Candidatus Paceibacterota bacterium]|jgi:hypothetical protein